MHNPLNKRFKRELKNGFGRYIVLFLLLFLSIGEVSGFLVADHSMVTAYEESFEKYNIEDGNFTSAAELSSEQISETENANVTLYENYFSDKETENNTTLRIFKNRTDVNIADLMEGELPDKENEIAIDRLYAKNNGLKPGDNLKTGDDIWQITGIVALPDYSALFKNNTDMMYDTTSFGVSVVSETGWGKIEKEDINYRYSWKYNVSPADEIREKEMSDDFLEKTGAIIPLTDYIPRYQNQAINFTGEDFGQDRAMIQLLLYIIIVIIAFIFAVTVKNTIHREAGVIGTLRSSGYTKAELLRHYLLLPVLVTIAGAVAGNVAGYTFLKDVNAAAYYDSYSLTTYKTLFNPEALILTTLIPVGIVILINIIILSRSLSYSPLNFLRGEISKKGGKKAMRLSHSTPIMSRFRKRIFTGNIAGYTVILIGIFFSNVLLLFGFMLPSVLDNYKDMIQSNMICDYTYILKAPAESDTAGAEKFSAYTLKTEGENGYTQEDINIYGIEDNSDYVNVADTGKTYISKAFADKYHIKQGDTFTLKEKFEDKDYDFTAEGIYENESAIAVYTGLERVNEMFDREAGFFNGYYSNEKISDIDEKLIATVADYDEMTKIAKQMDLSVGGVMVIIRAFAVMLFVIIIYILSRLIIEKNAKSISLAKILGYKNPEIGRLYILTTTIVVIVGVIATTALAYPVIKVLYTEMLMKSMNGCMPMNIGADVFIKMILIGICAYGAVAFFELLKIRKVRMNMILKEV